MVQGVEGLVGVAGADGLAGVAGLVCVVSLGGVVGVGQRSTPDDSGSWGDDSVSWGDDILHMIYYIYHPGTPKKWLACLHSSERYSHKVGRRGHAAYARGSKGQSSPWPVIYTYRYAYIYAGQRGSPARGLI